MYTSGSTLTRSGFSDITLDAGYLNGSLPFPLLTVAPGNQSYFYYENIYNLMNIGEFVSDHYVSLDIDHFFGGFFFNKIPGLNRLKLREVVGAKILYGGLHDQNNPALNPAQMKFPTTDGLTTTYPLGPKPYVEASVGIYNILYLHTPGRRQAFHLPRSSQHFQPRAPRQHNL